MFDEVKIFVKSGDGGDGISHFHREKYVSRGGPDGGDGGKGGDVIFVANKGINTLYDFQSKQKFVAPNGRPGGTNRKSGQSGDDLRIPVPLGTVVRNGETGEIIADLVKDKQEYIVVKGGRGGRGNQHFATPSNQAPRHAERGEPGNQMWVTLELRLIADVGIVGVPNAGKSTLLSVISNAKPKIAPYPFTTLEPNLGVVVIGDRDMVVADIPGLVEGAHRGVGLGHSFLRHVQRTRVLVHLLDGTAENPLADFNQINAELALFDERLGQKPQLIGFNKMDMPDAQERWEHVRSELEKRGYEVLALSGKTRQNTQELMNRVAALLAQEMAKEPETRTEETAVYELEPDPLHFTITRNVDQSYQVNGARIERAAAMTYWEIDESVARFQKILAATGITKALEEAGVQAGDTVFIGKYELEWGE
jgi:GTPase